MIPFVILIGLPALFCFVAVQKEHKRARILHLGKSEYIRENNLAIPTLFLLLFLMLAVRAESVGRDLPRYSYYFSLFRRASWNRMLAHDLDFLYKLLNWTVGRFTDSFHVLLAVVAALTIVPIAWIYGKERRHSYLKVLLFLIIGVLPMFFSGIRQCLAIASGMVAYHYTRKKRILPFLLSVCVAYGLHHSAFVLLLMYPIYHVTFKTKHLWFVVPIIVTLFIFNRQVFGLLGRAFPDYDFSTAQTGAYGTLCLLILFTMFSYIIPDEKKMDAEMLGLRNFLLLSVVLQCFAPIHSLAMRFNYYYLLFIPILIPRVIDAAKTKWKQVAKLSIYVLSALCMFVYADMLLTFYTTGRSSLDILPYIPFWKG